MLKKDEVKKVADLARIELTAEEEKSFALQLSSILEYFQDISQLEVGEAEVVDHYQLGINQVRSDNVSMVIEDQAEKIQAEFPNKKKGYLSVKQVL